MRLKLYRAATMADAMALLRCELGPEALILSTRRVAGGVELTAGLDQPDELPAPAPAPGPPPSAFDPAYHGVPAALAARLSGPDLVRALGAVLQFGPLPLPPDLAMPAPLLLAGPPGAGKTLSVARLATRLVLGGAAPVVITADGRRAGGAEELAAYTRLLGLTLVAVSTPASLARALGQAAPGTPILIDTAGANAFDPAELAEVSALMQVACGCAVLVMPAGGHPEEAGEQAAAFAALGVRHLLPTRLDLTRRLGSVLTAAGAGLILTEAGVGTGATDGLVPVSAEFLANRLRTWPAKSPIAHRTPEFPSARSRVAACLGADP